MTDPSRDAQKNSSYIRLLGYARPYWKRAAIGIACGVVFAAVNGLMVWFIKSGIKFINDPHPLSLTDLMHPGDVPVGQGTFTWKSVLMVLGCIPLIGLLRGLADYGTRYFLIWTGSRVVMDVRNSLFGKLLRVPLAFYSSRKTGELISRTMNDSALIEKSVSSVMEDIAKQPLTLLVMIGWVFYTDYRLALISMIAFPLCILPISNFGRRVRRYSREAQERIADVMSILQEAMGGARIIRAFGAERHELTRFGKEVSSFFGRMMKVTRSTIIVEPIIVFISFAGIALVLLYVKVTGMTVDEFVVFAMALMLMYEPVKKLSRIHLTIQQSSAAGDRIFELLDAPVQIEDKPGASPISVPIEQITFDRVGFTYGDNPVLNDISLDVKSGDRVALVGKTGAGKSTFVNLLPRLYDVTSGVIRINGRDIRDVTLESLRRQIGVVSQETFLFNDTVASNIQYGTWNASRENIIESAKAANADEFIQKLPKGYDTIIGDRGTRLSGGQCQRLAIARAMLRNPPILILDEAMSALDTESERMVQTAIDRLMTGRTVFAIAHRLSTIVNSTVILVLDQGKIVEQGTHAELIAQNGMYRRFHDLQFQTEQLPS